MEIEIQKVGTKEQDEYLESIKKGEEFWTTKEILKNLLIRIFPDCIILIDQPITIGKDLFKLDKNSKCISCKDFEFKEGLIQYPTFQIINHSKEFFLIFSYIDAESLINPEKCFQEIESHCQYKACGWKLLEFPYFIQASKENLLFLLNSQTKLFKDNKKYLNNLINLEYEINFPNGFIHPNQLSIGHFCAPALDYVRHVLDILPFNTTLEVFESCFYKAKNKNIPSYFIEYGVKYKVPIYQSSLNTDELYLKLRKYLDELFSISAIVSASLIAVYNVGILIEGNEGYGKSETTLELIKNGHQFVCDDNVLIVNKNGTLFGEAAKTHGGEYQYPMKIKGIGEIFIDDIFGVKSILKNKEINLRVIFSKEDYDEFIDNKFNFDFKDELDPLLGVKIPVMNINISTNRSIATLIEMIAIQYLSKYVFVNRKL